MRYVLLALFCAVIGDRAAADKIRTPEQAELCSIKTVAVPGEEDAAKETRKRVEKKTWLKKVSSPDQADAILEAEMFLTSFNMSFSEDQVTSASREGYVEMKLKRREPEKVLWEDKRPLDKGKPVDLLLEALQSQAGCQKP